MPFEKQIGDFFQRIDRRIEERKLPIELSDYILAPQLHEIYLFVKKFQGRLTVKLGNGYSYRFDKKNTRLERSFNLIFCREKNTIFLLLETKSKKSNGLKFSQNTSEMFQQSYRTTKAAWIIDGIVPIKMANTVFLDLKMRQDYLEVNNEALIVKKIVDLFPSSQSVFNTGIFGDILSDLKHNASKVSLYYPWPEGRHLSHFLSTKEGQIADCDPLALQLIQGIKYMHDANLVYQGLSNSNMLVFRNDEGGYNVKFSGFNQVSENRSKTRNAYAAENYESPEIVAQEKLKEYTSNAKKINFMSYGRALGTSIFPTSGDQFGSPAYENDMWALGIVLYRLYYKKHPTTENESEFSVLFKGLFNVDRKKRLTATQTLELFKQQSTLIYTQTKEKVDHFFEKIRERKREKILPNDLWGIIGYSQLMNIYAYVAENQIIIRKTLDQKKPLRLDKKKTGLDRTLNFVFDPKTEELSLIVETKSKNVFNKKIQITHFSGINKTTKLAWAIEDQTPKKMANSVYYVTSDEGLLNAKAELGVLHAILKKYPNSDKFLSIKISRGATFNKIGRRNNEKYFQKLSFYSSWAEEGDLLHYLNQKQWNLTLEEYNSIARQVVQAIQILHEAGVVHQDIKLNNFLVFLDENNHIQIKLADLGSAFTQEFSAFNRTPLPTLGYASPQIALMMCTQPEVNSYYYNYYTDPKEYSYGREIAKELKIPKSEYWNVSFADDMWALGILLHQLYNKGNFPKKGEESNRSKLLNGLLKTNREERLTAEQLLIKYFPEPKKVSDEKNSPEIELSLVQKMKGLMIDFKTVAPMDPIKPSQPLCYQPQYDHQIKSPIDKTQKEYTNPQIVYKSNVI